MTEMLRGWRRFITSLWALFDQKNCRQSAAALTYMTLFAIVPLVTVSYAMLSLFPDFAGLESKMQERIFAHFVPESGREVQEYISSFSAQAQRLTGVGVSILLVTAGLMLRNIEQTFNAIWDIPRGRRGVSSFLLYWAILSLGPILLGAGLAASTYLFSQKFIAEGDTLGVLPIVLRVLPWILTAMAFTLLFIAVPNCRVPFRWGLVGGVVTAFAFEAAKSLFGALVVRTSLQAIYGAFAFVPLFLLWVYLMWMILLAGCVLVRSLSAYHAAAQGRNYSDLVATLVLLWEAFRKYQLGLPLRDRDISRAGILPSQWQRLRQILQDRKLIAQTDGNDYVLQRDLDAITLMQLASWLQPPSVVEHGHKELQHQSWYREVERCFSETQQLSAEHMALDLGELFRRALEGEDDGDGKNAAKGKKSMAKDRSGRGGGKKKSDSDSDTDAVGDLSMVRRRNKRL